MAIIVLVQVSWALIRWEENTLSYGAYSYLGLSGSDADPSILGETVANKLFFAGEATDWDYQGSIQGAYFSGVRVASELFHHI